LKRTFSLVVLILLVSSFRVSAEESVAFKVIVNPGVSGTKIPRDTLAQIYLGNARTWSDGSAIAAVDLSTVSPVRRAFSRSVLGTPVDAVKQHWLRSASSGKRPPAVKESDAAVVAFVSSARGAVGYVSQDAELPATVRVLVVE
jgi:ABC-type phosphate transport system substrate-binding protein